MSPRKIQSFDQPKEFHFMTNDTQRRKMIDDIYTEIGEIEKNILNLETQKRFLTKQYHLLMDIELTKEYPEVLKEI